jgi:putative endonuclease
MLSHLIPVIGSMDRANNLNLPVFMYYVYLLQSLKNNSLYIGYAPDLKKRVVQHNVGRVASTRAQRPWRVVYYEAYAVKKDATRREHILK